MPKTQPTPAHLALREATASLHTELEGRMPLSAPAVSLGDYLRHLEFMREWIEASPDWPSQDTHLNEVARVLNQDMAIADTLLAHTRATRGVALSARSGESAEPQTPAAWGFAYVLHGSQLGNQVLYRRWAGALAPHPLALLRGNGSGTLSHWKQFLSSLGENVSSAQAIDESCASAVNAFRNLLRIAAAKGAA